LIDRLTHHRRSSEPNTEFRESQPDHLLNRVLQHPQPSTDVSGYRMNHIAEALVLT